MPPSASTTSPPPPPHIHHHLHHHTTTTTTTTTTSTTTLPHPPLQHHHHHHLHHHTSTAGQLACIGEVARRIYHQTYPLLAQDVAYFDDRSLVLRSLFSARVSFRRKKAVLIRYHRMMLRLLRPYYLYATIQDQIRSQRES